MIIGLVSDFLPECKSKRSFGLFIHHAGTFGVKVLSMFLKLMFEEKRKEEKDKLKQQQKEERRQLYLKQQAQKEKEEAQKAKQAEKNPFSVIAEDKEVMDDASVVFTELFSRDHLPKGSLSLTLILNINKRTCQYRLFDGIGQCGNLDYHCEKRTELKEFDKLR